MNLNQIENDPKDQRWLWREAGRIDPAGNRLCLLRAGENSKTPLWRING